MNRLRQWRLIGSAVGGERHFWLDKLIFGLDRVLRRWQSVVEYTHDPTCILRIKVGRLDRDFVLADGTAGHVGDRFIDLHLWNEQVPAMPKEGASIAWARQMSFCFQQSLRQLARYLASRPDLDDISLVRCTMEFGGRERDNQMVRLIGRYGFELVPSATTVTMGERPPFRRKRPHLTDGLGAQRRGAEARHATPGTNPSLYVSKGARTTLWRRRWQRRSAASPDLPVLTDERAALMRHRANAEP